MIGTLGNRSSSAASLRRRQSSKVPLAALAAIAAAAAAACLMTSPVVEAAPAAAEEHLEGTLHTLTKRSASPAGSLVVRQGRGPVSVSKFRLRKKSLEEEEDEGADSASPMDKRMSMMRLKKPSFMRLRRGPSMMRLKKMTQMRLKKSGMEQLGGEENEENEGCMWIGGNCYTRNEVELAAMLAQERL